MNSQIYNSVWEAQNRIQGEEPVGQVESNVQEEEEEDEGLPLEEDDYQKFLMDEESKRRKFQEQMGLEGEGELDFKTSELELQHEF